MKVSPIAHGGYFLISVLAFVAGLQLAGRSVSDGGSHVNRPPADTENSMNEQARLSALTSGAPQGDHQSRGGASTMLGNLPVADAPLSRDLIEALVLAAIKSPSPIERRKAFDRLLREMHLPTFSAERSMLVRRMMFENGTDGEQWRLFDYAWGSTSPDTAIAHIGEIPERFRDVFLGNILPGLASSKPQAAIELFSSLEPGLQAKLRNRFFEGLIDYDVATATEHIFAATNERAYDWRPMDVMTREIVKDRGLTPALEWAAELPEGPLRGSAWSAAYAHWAATEPHTAIDSIIAMPESADRNQAINGFISAHAHQDGETAAIWAAEITQPGMREEAMVRAGKQFYQQDPDAAAQWFGNSGLPQQRWSQLTTPN